MNEQFVSTNGFSYGQASLLIFISVAVAMVYAHKSKWAKLATPFRTDKKLSAEPAQRYKTIKINQQPFRHLVCIPTQKGLYLSHRGLIPELIVRDRILVPWSACSDLISKGCTVLGITVNQYFINIKTPAGSVELMITENIAQQILRGGFLKLTKDQ
jgi:hypothetical protein